MPPAPKYPAVILLHRLPDESSHFDWLIARDGPADASLLTFRVGLRPDDPHVTAFSAEKLPDHRAFYLDYEGSLEPKAGLDRGSVTRLARGTASIVSETDGTIEINADWGAGHRRYVGTLHVGGTWRFIRTHL